MQTLTSPLAVNQQERRPPPAVPPAGRADKILFEGERRRHAYRSLNPSADTAMVYGAQVGYLHAQMRMLCAELDALNIVRDETLDYLTVDYLDISTQIVVGYAYEPGCQAKPTSAYTYVTTGDPGDPAESEELELVEVWVNGCDVAGVLSSDAIYSISEAVLAKIRLLQAKGREMDGDL